MHKTFIILALFSMGFTHAAAGEESGALRLYPLTGSAMEGNCDFQLKGTNSPKIRHFSQSGICFAYDAKGLPVDVKDCTAVSQININNSQIVLRNISQGAGYESARYKNDDYAVEIEHEERDCLNKKVSCSPFYLDAVLTVKKGSLQQAFEMQGSCHFPN